MDEPLLPETADIETSTDDYASRFAGPTGEWMLSVQERTVALFLKDTGAKSVIDVGGGHGQLAGPLYQRGYSVSVFSSNESCKRRIADLVDSGLCRFQVGDVTRMPFADRSFDAVLSFRLLPHCERWKSLVSELCRISTKHVIVDFPTTRSFNKLAPAMFDAKKKIEKNTRRWRMFSDREIAAEFASHGFRIERRMGQFFFPMALHRMLKCKPLSVAMERCSRTVGLNALFGSPVIVRAGRK